MAPVKDARDAYLAAFESRVRDRNGLAWFEPARRAAIDRFASLGFPTREDEEWRFTSVAPIAERGFAGAAPARPRIALPKDPPAGLRVGLLGGSLPSERAAVEPVLDRVNVDDRHPFAALNAAFLSDVLLVGIPAGAALSGPVEVDFDEPEGLVHPRVLVLAGEGSRATIVETYAGKADWIPAWTNAVTEIVVGPGAQVYHVKIQAESSAAFHTHSIRVRQERDAGFSSWTATFGGALSRNDVRTILDGEGAAVELLGLFVASTGQLLDNHTTIDHARPRGRSREFYKGILGGAGKGVFNGKIIVRPGAQKTDARQTNKNLVLSKEAVIHTKPQLEIRADDVKCAHGASIGRLDESAMFYLRSRGIEAREARRILIRAFAAEILEPIPGVPVRARIASLLERRLALALGGEASP